MLAIAHIYPVSLATGTGVEHVKRVNIKRCLLPVGLPLVQSRYGIRLSRHVTGYCASYFMKILSFCGCRVMMKAHERFCDELSHTRWNGATDHS